MLKFIEFANFHISYVISKLPFYGVKRTSKVGQLRHEHLFQTAVDQSQIEISSKVRYHIIEQGIAYLTI